MQGVKATNPIPFHFNAQTPNPLADVSFTLLTLFGSDGSVIAAGSFLWPDTTSITLPTNTLVPGVQYSFDLDYTDRLQSFGPTGTEILFDIRTDGVFTTAAVVPEPCGLALAGIALAGSAAWSNRKRAR